MATRVIIISAPTRVSPKLIIFSDRTPPPRLSGFAANDVDTTDPHLISASVLSTTLVDDYADLTALGVVPIGDGKEVSAQTVGHIRAGSQMIPRKARPTDNQKHDLNDLRRMTTRSRDPDNAVSCLSRTAGYACWCEVGMSEARVFAFRERHCRPIKWRCVWASPSY